MEGGWGEIWGKKNIFKTETTTPSLSTEKNNIRGAPGKQAMNAGSQQRHSADVHKKVSARCVGDLSKP